MNATLRTVLECLVFAWFVPSATLGATPRPDVAAIYFPGFHQDPHYDAWIGEGWNEWRLLERAKPRFVGQHFFFPEWGTFDEASPIWMERQIDLATRHGVNVFVFDWYWYSGVKILERPLREGFLKAANRNQMKYGLMWANHDWRNYFPTPVDQDPTLWLPSRSTPADFERLMADCLAHHFHQPNYWRVQGGLFFGVFDPDKFIEQLAGPEKTATVIARAREQVAQAGLGKLHLAAFGSVPDNIPRYREAGFDSTTTYNITASERAALPGHPLDDYADLAARHPVFWKGMDSGVLPHLPVVTVGWDPSPRWQENCPFPPPNRGYPYTPVVTNTTPEQFGVLIGKALDHAATSRLPTPAILINAWNEWTEGSALLPDRHYKTRFLDELERALRTHAVGKESAHGRSSTTRKPM